MNPSYFIALYNAQCFLRCRASVMRLRLDETLELNERFLQWLLWSVFLLITSLCASFTCGLLAEMAEPLQIVVYFWLLCRFLALVVSVVSHFLLVVFLVTSFLLFVRFTYVESVCTR